MIQDSSRLFRMLQARKLPMKFLPASRDAKVVSGPIQGHL
ncbi:hypothetical protein GEOBRER4_n1687 [Citrifermentans bremense]|uniref:Uncharacterized protein n=2 Tax=Geobacteraceae TaxID=213422 RepID=A0ABQ0MI03_9BACT|nr:hypothetical protein GEOBRER4_n1687 [Citrifermentans bremense]GAW66716.1 hypothetical protein GPEL0_01f2197 [Geoanaerobacter pelophilus]